MAELDGRSDGSPLTRDETDRREESELATSTGDDFLRLLARHLSRRLAPCAVIVGELAGECWERIRTRASSREGRDAPGQEYDLAGSPCEGVVGRATQVHERGLREAFPDCSIIQELEAESYVGVPLFDSAGRAVGLIGMLGAQPLEEPERACALLERYSARAAGVIELRSMLAN